MFLWQKWLGFWRTSCKWTFTRKWRISYWHLSTPITSKSETVFCSTSISACWWSAIWCFSYERKIMNDSVPRKSLTYNKENRYLYCSYCLAFEPPNTCNPSPFVRGFSIYRHISQSLALHEPTTAHVRNAQWYISVVNDGTLDNFLQHHYKKAKKNLNRELLSWGLQIS